MENEKITIKVGYLPSIEVDICEQKTFVYEIPESGPRPLLRKIYLDILSYANSVYEKHTPDFEEAYYLVITIIPNFDYFRVGGERFCKHLKAYLEFEEFFLSPLIAVAER